MANPNIKIKRSAVPGKRPTRTQLPLGELGLNTYDGQLFAQVDTGGVGIGTTVASLTPWKETYGRTAVYYDNSVGVGTDSVTEKLTVFGDASISTDLTVGGNLNVSGDLVYDEVTGRNLNISGIATFSNVVLTGSVSAASSTGTSGQYLVSTGTGVTWSSAAAIRSGSSTVATAGTDRFAVNYTAGLLDVYVNGVKLAPSDFTASSGSLVILNEEMYGGEVVDFHAFSPSSTGAAPNILHTPPSTSSSNGIAGQQAYDSDYLYVCIATNSWKRVALSTF